MYLPPSCKVRVYLPPCRKVRLYLLPCRKVRMYHLPGRTIFEQNLNNYTFLFVLTIVSSSFPARLAVLHKVKRAIVKMYPTYFPALDFVIMCCCGQGIHPPECSKLELTMVAVQYGSLQAGRFLPFASSTDFPAFTLM